MYVVQKKKYFMELCRQFLCVLECAIDNVIGCHACDRGSNPGQGILYNEFQLEIGIPTVSLVYLQDN